MPTFYLALLILSLFSFGSHGAASLGRLPLCVFPTRVASSASHLKLPVSSVLSLYPSAPLGTHRWDLEVLGSG